MRVLIASTLTTYEKLDCLREKKICFLTLHRRSRQMLGRIYSLPASMWTRVSLWSLTCKYHTPRVFDERVKVKDYNGELRQLSIVDLGHEEPTILLTNDFKSKPAALITRYARRMLIEDGIAEAIHFFHIDALSSMVSRRRRVAWAVTGTTSAVTSCLKASKRKKATSTV